MKQKRKTAKRRKIYLLSVLLLFFAGVTACGKEQGKQRATEPAQTPAPSAARDDIPVSSALPQTTAGPTPVSEKYIYTGSCGENVKWKLNVKTGKMIIWGNGDMKDYTVDHGTYPVPWCKMRDEIKKVVVKEGVTAIGKNAFKKSSLLTGIKLADSVKRINEYAFLDCNNLEDISVLKGIEFIGIDAFSGCPGLKKMKIGGPCTETIKWKLNTKNGRLVIWGEGAMEEYGGVYYQPPWYYITDEIKEVVVREGVTSIGENAFKSCDFLTDIKLASTVRRIDKHAFKNCKKLKEIQIPSTVRKVGCAAFFSCKGLKKVVLGDGVKVIERYAFAYCDKLEDISLPDNIEYIGACAFRNCPGLGKIEIIRGVCGNRNGENAGADVKWELNTKTGRMVIWGNGEIRNFWEKGCDDYLTTPWYGIDDRIKEVVIKEGVTAIGDYAFARCDTLTGIEMAATVKKIGISAFEECDGLKRIRIPSTVKEIGMDAFLGCSRLKNLIFEEGVKIIGIDAFGGCDSLKEVSLPKSIKYIGSGAFRGCYSLTKVRIKGEIKPWRYSLWRTGVFQNCTSLSQVNLSKRVETIPKKIFEGCKKIKKVVLPENVKEIQARAFGKCRNLRTIVIRSKKLERVHSKVFYGLLGGIDIYVPKEKLKEYRKLFRESGIDLDLNKITLKGLEE